MATVYGENFQKMYIDEPKELGNAGLQHTKLRCLSDKIASAVAADKCFIGELPDEAIILSAEVLGSATVVTLEDEAGNAIAIGERISGSRRRLVAVPAGALANELILVKYLQC